ncbi:hypothetical protein [Candidatus Clostridium stratigraminis]|uniref:HNH endonuclease n=1 Tax=Candidatus Clostridium stratigraminis TaxID=3381661 RepID=A0ABW8TA20_9CLOT
MEQSCKLCGENKKLAESHIIPKMFFNYIKKESLTKGIRTTDNPNKRLQDGLKTPFLCHECEELFSKYEKYFSDKFFQKTINSSELQVYETNTDELRYFILSIAWRVLKLNYETDIEMLKSLTQNEKNELNNVMDNWKDILYNEKIKELKNIQMHFIPIEKLNRFNNNLNMVYNNTGMDFRVLGAENSFKHAYVYIKIPYFIFLCSVWGHTPNLKQYLVGKTITPKDSNLPKWLNDLLDYHLENFKVAQKNISQNQLDSIIKKINK